MGFLNFVASGIVAFILNGGIALGLMKYASSLTFPAYPMLNSMIIMMAGRAQSTNMLVAASLLAAIMTLLTKFITDSIVQD